MYEVVWTLLLSKWNYYLGLSFGLGVPGTKKVWEPLSFALFRMETAYFSQVIKVYMFIIKQLDNKNFEKEKSP